MKELILDNPPRRKGKSKKRRTAAQRRATAKLVASNRRKRKGRKSTKRRVKRTAVKRRRTRTSTVRTYKSMKRKSTRRRKACSRRRKSRTFLVRGTATPLKMNGLIGGIFSRDNLMIAGGAVTGTIVANYVLNNRTVVAKLPKVADPYFRAAYLAAVPIVGGVLLRKVSPGIAKGMIIGGLVNGIAQLVTAFNVLPPGQTAPTMTAAPDAGTVRAASEYLGEYLGDYSDDYSADYSDPSYMGEYLGDDFSEDGSVESTGSFADSAW